MSAAGGVCRVGVRLMHLIFAELEPDVSVSGERRGPAGPGGSRLLSYPVRPPDFRDRWPPARGSRVPGLPPRPSRRLAGAGAPEIRAYIGHRRSALAQADPSSRPVPPRASRVVADSRADARDGAWADPGGRQARVSAARPRGGPQAAPAPAVGRRRDPPSSRTPCRHGSHARWRRRARAARAAAARG